MKSHIDKLTLAQLVREMIAAQRRGETNTADRIRRDLESSGYRIGTGADLLTQNGGKK